MTDDKYYAECTHYYRFLRDLKAYHHLDESEFTGESVIEYESSLIRLEVVGHRNVRVTRKPEFKEYRHNAKLGYVPSERNLISSVRNIERIYRSNTLDYLFNFIAEWREAKMMFTSANSLELIVSPGMRYYYDQRADKEVIALADGKRISPYYASSGVQAVLPVLAIAGYLAGCVGQSNFSVEELSRAVSRDRFKYKRFSLYVEEPEQNLFPSTQYDLIMALASYLSIGEGSSIVMTTHSPYVLSTLNVLRRQMMAWRREPQLVIPGLPAHPVDVTAYILMEDGTARRIIDTETGLIAGEQLDGIADTLDELTYRLNTVIYADIE